VSLHVPTSFWAFLKCVDLHVPTYLFILKRDAKTKTCECNFLLFFSMPPRYRVHGALKNAKAENILMILFNAGIGK
jgi:hypothetical protein